MAINLWDWGWIIWGIGQGLAFVVVREVPWLYQMYLMQGTYFGGPATLCCG